MAARLATTDADFQRAGDNLLAVGSPPTLRSGQTLRKLFERDEGAVVVDDAGGVITAHVERDPNDGPDCIWVGHIQGPPSSWRGLIVAMCRVSQERGTDKLPVYRVSDPASPLTKHFKLIASEVEETRPDGKIVLKTTIARILKALGEG